MMIELNKAFRIVNAEATVVLILNIAAPENGLYIVFRWLFLLLFFPQKKVERKDFVDIIESAVNV